MNLGIAGKMYDARQLFGICPYTSCTPKFWHTHVIMYGDFMVIVEPWWGHGACCWWGY